MLTAAMSAQTIKWQELYKVKKKDTIYGIAKKYNITIDELISANPAMQKPDYTLQKGDQLLIPYHHNAGNSHNTCRNCIEDTNSKPRHTQARGRRKRAHRRNAAASQR